jgi:hypothetical protein
MKWCRSFFITIYLAGISACYANSTPEPTLTPIQAPPFMGKLFFDMNGSGLQDESSFVYDSKRLSDERQPLQADLLVVITDYVNNHPDLKDGDLITLAEPDLSGYEVCIKDECKITTSDGSFSIPNNTGSTVAHLKITDPNANIPALAMRYINEWKGSIVVEAYMMNNVEVPKQQLTNTNIIPIKNGVNIKFEKVNTIGLIQGFLTIPFISTQIRNPTILSYFDIVGNRLFDDNGKNTFFTSQDGITLSYDGLMTKPEYWDSNGNVTIGVGDSHTGYDYLVPIGNYIISSGRTSENFNFCLGDKDCNYEIRINNWFIDPDNQNEHFGNCYGHLNAILINSNQTVYRGQIIGLSGNSGYDTNGRPPMLHFHLDKRVLEGWKYFDPYRTIIKTDPLPQNYWGSEVSYWTVDNLPQFTNIELPIK